LVYVIILELKSYKVIGFEKDIFKTKKAASFKAASLL